MLRDLDYLISCTLNNESLPTQVCACVSLFLCSVLFELVQARGSVSRCKLRTAFVGGKTAMWIRLASTENVLMQAIMPYHKDTTTTLQNKKK